MTDSAATASALDVSTVSMSTTDHWIEEGARVRQQTVLTLCLANI